MCASLLGILTAGAFSFGSEELSTLPSEQPVATTNAQIENIDNSFILIFFIITTFSRFHKAYILEVIIARVTVLHQKTTLLVLIMLAWVKIEQKKPRINVYALSCFVNFHKKTPKAHMNFLGFFSIRYIKWYQILERKSL